MRVGIIGAGAIATYLLEEQHKYNYTVTSIFVRNKDKYEHFVKKYHVEIVTDFNKFLKSNIDIVIEAANIEAVEKFLPLSIAEKDTIVISIGALTDHVFMQKIKQIALQNKTSIYLPSGAIGGLDFIQNASESGNLEEVTLETRKPAHTLIEKNITEEKVVFDGSAIDAIKLFPKNINVSIALSLAGIGLENTKVRIIADPLTNRNSHTIFTSGEFGEATFQVINEPLPTNPKTSFSAAMSIVGTLQRQNKRIKIGI